ncbi:MAG TPA: YbaB/EbfC family nucleoid-associated protein [Streptosporangiaceae bacterium]|nr:YbaB/EbfC family nucleoid-associated protein [Streptosporangiaceae bacterium]
MGAGDFGGADFERLLGEARRALGALSSGEPAEPAAAGANAEPVTGEGSAADGKVTAKVVAGGHLEELTVDPRLLRSGSEELCAQIKIAVNAAIDDLRVHTTEAAPATMDPAALAGMLQELQSESIRQMARFSQGVAETVEKINAAAKGERHG